MRGTEPLCFTVWIDHRRGELKPQLSILILERQPQKPVQDVFNTDWMLAHLGTCSFKPGCCARLSAISQTIKHMKPYLCLEILTPEPLTLNYEPIFLHLTPSPLNPSHVTSPAGSLSWLAAVRLWASNLLGNSDVWYSLYLHPPQQNHPLFPLHERLHWRAKRDSHANMRYQQFFFTEGCVVELCWAI